MIQPILDALAAALTAQSEPGLFADGVTTITTSQVDVQPTGNVPLIQLKFVAEMSPSLAWGIFVNGFPMHFQQEIQLELYLRDAAPAPECWKRIFNLWFGLNADSSGVQGVEMALLDLIGTGLTVNGQIYRVAMGETKPHPPRDAWTANLCCPLQLITVWSQ